MHFKTSVAVLAAAGAAAAQRPDNVTPCDYYTKALLMENTAANQLGLLTNLVNTAVIGNFTTPNMNAVPGILTPGTYQGTKVNLLQYFDGSLKSTNAGGQPMSVNFLDGGAAAPLMKSMPANDQSSAQYILLTHLYSYFGTLLGCSTVGTSGFPAYAGSNSMYSVHKYMVLEPAEVGYFIMNVGLAASSFGVTDADVKYVGDTLTKLFDYRCSPATAVVPSGGKQLQSICTDSSCPLDPNAMCSAYGPPAPEPVPAGSGGASPTGGSASPTGGAGGMGGGSSGGSGGMGGGGSSGGSGGGSSGGSGGAPPPPNSAVGQAVPIAALVGAAAVAIAL